LAIAEADRDSHQWNRNECEAANSRLHDKLADEACEFESSDEYTGAAAAVAAKAIARAAYAEGKLDGMAAAVAMFRLQQDALMSARDRSPNRPPRPPDVDRTTGGIVLPSSG
jgi:hypothetical protein